MRRAVRLRPKSKQPVLFLISLAPVVLISGKLELELIQTQMAQKPMLRAEVGMRVRCANKASAE
jgi:hypothetical protein